MIRIFYGWYWPFLCLCACNMEIYVLQYLIAPVVKSDVTYLTRFSLSQVVLASMVLLEELAPLVALVALETLEPLASPAERENLVTLGALDSMVTLDELVPLVVLVALVTLEPLASLVPRENLVTLEVPVLMANLVDLASQVCAQLLLTCTQRRSIVLQFFWHVDTRPLSQFLFFFNSTFYLCIIIVNFYLMYLIH